MELKVIITTYKTNGCDALAVAGRKEKKIKH